MYLATHTTFWKLHCDTVIKTPIYASTNGSENLEGNVVMYHHYDISISKQMNFRSIDDSIAFSIWRMSGGHALSSLELCLSRLAPKERERGAMVAMGIPYTEALSYFGLTLPYCQRP
jgi:hypothetical protein